jgi:hypothetical protein
LVPRLQGELKSQQFRGVILMADPRTPTGQAIIERTHFYSGFCTDVLASYEVNFVEGGEVSLVPKPGW